MRPPPRPPSHVNVNVTPLSERELDELQGLLERVPAPLEPLDLSMLDGYLCGVLVQPVRVPLSRWWPHVIDAEARPVPAGVDTSRLQALVQRRHAELDDAIARRQWFDPWVFELDGESDADGDGMDEAPASVHAVYPWVVGFATAMECFPDLMQREPQAITEPLALIFRHLDPDDLEDADELLAEIEMLEPPEDLSAAVEELVRATLLLADVGRPVAPARPAPRQRAPAPRGGPARRR